MIEALLIPHWEGCPPSNLQVLGVSFGERIIQQARKAGFKKILQGPKLSDVPSQFLILSPNILLSDAGWRRLNSLEPREQTLTVPSETNCLAIIRCQDTDFVSRTLEESDSYSILLTKLSAQLGRETISLAKRDWARFESPSQRPHVEAWLLRGLIKDSEGFMSRYVERKISLSVTRKLVNTPVTPNAMTFLSLAIGIVGAFCFIPAKNSSHLVGAFLFWLHSVLDGCDGELARLKFAESRWGGLLDFWGDNVVHAAVFSAIAAGVYIKKPSRAPVLLAASAVSGTLLSASMVYWTTMRSKPADGPLFTSVIKSSSPHLGNFQPAEKIADLLARRDFIYLVGALAMAGRVKWFLWMGSIGAPLYFLALAALSLKNSTSMPNMPNQLVT
ncbi:MAG TPA: CDP-alcohol phosphatidyltransferase family protein [Terrimicrobiaceae bacterium]